MIRGTTPTLEFALPFEVDLIAEAYVTISQNQSVVIDKSLSELTCAGKTLTVKLSQEDTLKLQQSEFKTAEVQIRVRMKSGDALASDIMRLHVGRILKEVSGVDSTGGVEVHTVDIPYQGKTERSYFYDKKERSGVYEKNGQNF